MRKHILVVTTAMVFVLAMATVAMAADPHVGTWKLNLAKSKFDPSLTIKSLTQKIDAQDNGIKVVLDGVNSEGQAAHFEFTAKYDGKDYPYTGSQTIDTIALRRIDANTFASVIKKGGKEVGNGRNAISKDGKTMTMNIKEKNAQGQDVNHILVFDKQ